MTGDINWPTVIAVLVAVVGGGAGLAALSRSGADQSKTFSESAQIVVDLMKAQTIELAARVTAIESELQHVSHWGERVLDVLERAVDRIPQPDREEFRQQAEKLREERRHPRPKG